MQFASRFFIAYINCGHTWLLRFAILFSLLLCCGNAFAQQVLAAVIDPDYDSDTDTNEEGERWSSMFDVVIGRAEGVHKYVSGELEATAKSVDQFFADDNAFDESTKTYLRLGLDSVWRENEGLGFAGGVRLKVDLPNTKKRLRLLIESDAQRGETENLEDKPGDVAQESEYSVALEKEVSGLDLWNVRPSLGIRLHTPVDPFVRVRSYRYFPLSQWVIRVSSGVSWFDSRGFGTNGALEFDRALNDDFLFRYSQLLSWREDEMFRRFSQGLSLFQQIDSRQQIAYQIIARADDEDLEGWRSKRYDILARYRRNLYKKWLFGEIIPQWTYLRESGFNSTPALIFRLEMVFGERYR